MDGVFRSTIGSNQELPSIGVGTMSAPDPAARFADRLRTLYAEAGKPLYAELQRQAAAQVPPLSIRESTLSGWLSGRSVPRSPQVFRFLVEYLERKAPIDVERLGAARWERLRQSAERYRMDGQRNRRINPSRVLRRDELSPALNSAKSLSILPARVAADLLCKMDRVRAANLLAEMDPIAATNRLAEVEPAIAAEVMENMAEEIAAVLLQTLETWQAEPIGDHLSESYLARLLPKLT
jgi:hypothetical protein